MKEIHKFDDSIEQKFRDKNNKILIDNILRQIDDNDSSLRLTLNNKIELISSEILKKINFVLKDSSIEYDFKDIQAVFSTYEGELKNYISSYADNRKKTIIDASVNNESFSFEKFVEVIDSFFLSNKDDLESGINKIIYSDLESALFSTIKFSDEEQKQLVVSYLKRFDFKLTSTVEESFSGRNNSLKNLVSETHEKVNSLNVQTSEISNSIVKNKAA